MLAAYRPRYAKVAALAGVHERFEAIAEFAPKVGVTVPLEARDDATALCAYRATFADAIHEHHLCGESARS